MHGSPAAGRTRGCSQRDGRVWGQDQHPPRPGIAPALPLGDAMVLTGAPASAAGSSSAEGLGKPGRAGVGWEQRAAVATRELSEFHPRGSPVWKPFSPGTRGKLQLMAVSNQSGPAGVGRTPTGSSGNVKNEFNQVSSPFEEAIKIKAGHTSAAFPVPVTVFRASSWNAFSIETYPPS